MSTPAEAAIAADLASPRFRVGVVRGHWRQVSYSFPVLTMAVAAIEPDRSGSEYVFRFELTGFPGTAPEVQIWDCDANAVLAQNRRPKGSARVLEAFKVWGPGTVYRPWERQSGAHNEWAKKYPELAWHPKRDLAFVLEDIHGLLISNAGPDGTRPTT